MGSQGFVAVLMFSACFVVPPGWILASILTAGVLALPGLGERDRNLKKLWDNDSL
jgi:hypothetical protein